MKKALVLVAMLGLVASANATVHLFWTGGDAGYGLTNQGQINPVSNEAYEFTPSAADVSDDTVPTYTNNLDYSGSHYDVSTFPTFANAATDLTEDTTKMAYLWIQFEGENDGVKLLSAMFDYSFEGDATWAPNQVTYYKQDNLGGTPDANGFPTNKKRWDGASTMPGYGEFEQDPQTLTAVTGYGIVNAAKIANMFNPDMWNMWDADNRVALVGAVDISENNIGTMSINIPTDGNGDPLFVISNVPTAPVVHGVTIPEPASMLLLGLAGLLIRRR
jgi:hypothetical protein